jgi:hypothetical protein
LTDGPHMPWTAEQAAAMASTGGFARAKAIKTRAENARLAQIQAAQHVAENYVGIQLTRTRKQIEICNDLLEDPGLDWKARKATADAKARLYEIEAALANRPKPGAFRPSKERVRAPVDVDPIGQETRAPAGPKKSAETEGPIVPKL